MVRFVVILLVLLQKAAEKNRAGNHDEICSDDNHNDGYKEERQRLERLFNAERNVIGTAEQKNSENTENPIALRRFFTRLLALDKRNGA